MAKFKRVTELNNEFEAGLLEAALLEEKIPHLIKSYYDSALDGIFQNQKGWGCVLGLEENHAQISGVLEAIRANHPDEEM
jgi:hypothetical protein